MQNWEPGMPGRVFLSALKNNLGDKKLQWIAASDIGHFAALAFNDPEGYNHKAIGLAGDNLNVAEVSQTFKEALNYNQQPAFGFLGSVLTTLVSEVGLMVRYGITPTSPVSGCANIACIDGSAQMATARILRSARICIQDSRRLISG
jgi:hypothetical protein